MSLRFPNRQQILTAIMLAATALLIFVLPWLVPVSRRVVSDSYNLGFNNMVAVLSVGATLLALTALRLGAQNSREVWNAINSSSGFSFREIRLAIIVSAIAALFAGVAWLRLPLHYYSEIRWFIPSIELMLLGRTPYTQFQWNYGPVFLYVPVWLVQLSGGRIGADGAYIVSLLISTVAGLGLLAYVTSVLPAGKRALFFLLAAIPFVFNISLGMNYTALRFAAPYAALLWLHRQATIKIAAETANQTPLTPRAALPLALVFAIGAVGCFAISPETGLGFALSALTYLAALSRGQARPARVLLMAAMFTGIAGSAIFLKGVSRDYFLSLASFGGGGGNFPVVPSVYVLFYLGTLACVVPILAAHGLKNRGSVAALSLSWAALATIFVAPSLGRSDPGHIFCNGLGAFLGGALLLQVSFPRAPIYNRLYLGAFALLFSAGLPLISLDHSLGPIGAVWHAIENGERKPDRRFWNPAPREASAREARFEAALKSYPKIGTPLGCDERMEIFLKRTHRFVPEFFTPPAQNMLTENHVARKLQGISQMPIILVPIAAIDRPVFQENQKQYAAWRGDFLSRLLLFPIPYRYRNPPLFAELQATVFVRRHFSVAGRMDSYYIMCRRAETIVGS